MVEGEGAPDALRLEVVDALRGFALTGLFLVHMVEAFELYWAAPKPDVVTDTIFLLFMGKSFSLLALCFGFSFFVIMDRAERRGVDFTGRFAWRLLVLALIGWAHAIVYRGDIIQLLAVCGLVLLAANRIRSNTVLLALAGLCFPSIPLVVRMVAAFAGAEWANADPHFYHDPAMPIYVSGSLAEVTAANLGQGQVPKWWFYYESGRLAQILGLYLVGLVLGRIGFFGRLQDFARERRLALAAAVIAWIGLYGFRHLIWDALEAVGYGQGVLMALEMLLVSYNDLTATLIWALLLLALWQSRGRWLLRPMVPMGRMTLTLYVAQSVIFVPVFYGYGLGLHDDLSAWQRLALGIVAAALMTAGAGAWLARFHYGPLEWLWRAATFLSTNIPFRRPRRQSGDAT